jgi:hypothetical protein
VATAGGRKGEVGWLFDEVQNLVEPTERLHTDVEAGAQRGRTPERRGRRRAGPTNCPTRPDEEYAVDRHAGAIRVRGEWAVD